MQLVYRGVSYPVTSTTVNTDESKQGIIYRGHSYTRCRPMMIAQLSQRNLTYRGITYTTQQQANNPFI